MTPRTNESGRDFTAELTDDLHFLTRDEMAQDYAVGLGRREQIDWPTVNRAIIENWSKSGLIYIKRKAWKLRDAGAVRP